MSAPRIRALVLALSIGGVWGQTGSRELPASQLKLLPASVQKLAHALVRSQPKERSAICHRILGKPTRDAGSGLTIWQWDFPEGTLSVTEQFPDSPLFRLKSGRLIYLIPTNTPVAKSLQAEHEMFAPMPKYKGMSAFIGVLDLALEGTYTFTDSGTNLEHRAGQKRNFFMKHPTGRYTVTYAKGIGPKTTLESLAAKAVVAKLTFEANGGKSKVAFDVACDPDLRRMRFSGPAPRPFNLEWNF